MAPGQASQSAGITDVSHGARTFLSSFLVLLGCLLNYFRGLLSQVIQGAMNGLHGLSLGIVFKSILCLTECKVQLVKMICCVEVRFVKVKNLDSGTKLLGFDFWLCDWLPM